MVVDQTGPSATARRVAAYRRTFDRLEAPSGNPSADDRLADDVAGDSEAELDEHMARYLRARTSFFDRIVVKALDRGVPQLVGVGAGYDGRALRYARSGVRWFEVDDPRTQDDKRRRLERLGLDTSHVTFVGIDLRDADTASALVDHGFETEAPSQIWCEGVAAYLDPNVLGRVLAGLRRVATIGTRLAISFSTAPTSEEQAERRGRLRAAVEALGEPIRTSLAGEEADDLLTARRWRPAEVSERSRRAGFVVASPLWVPPPTSVEEGRDTVRPSRVGAYMEQTFHRAGTEHLAEHLVSRYGIDVDRVRELDVGVFRVERTDGPSWIARVFPAARPLAGAEGDAAILRLLEHDGFPAERCAHPEAVSTLEGQAVLVTKFVVGTRAGTDRQSLRDLGALLGRLHTTTGAWAETQREGGAWHHLAFEGGPREEIGALLTLLDASEGRVLRDQTASFTALRDEVANLDDGRGLPRSFLHPDFVPPNVVISPETGPTMIDWTGAGLGPRLSSLGFLLWAAGHQGLRTVDAVMAGYTPAVRLEADELDRLGAAVLARPLVLECWAFCTGRKTLAEVVDGLPEVRDRAAAFAARARRATGR